MKRICVLIPALVLICQLAFSTTYTVINTSDVGTGSLRQAVADANANPGADIINFQIPGNGPHIIQITSPLIITDPVNIDGYSENGAFPAGANYPAKIKIIIDGNYNFIMGIQVDTPGSGSTIEGLAIVNFDQSPYAGIYLNGCNNVIVRGNYIGIEPDGITTAGNYYGIYLFGADNSAIGGNSVAAGNLISGNLNDGVHLELSGASDEALNNIIQFNCIGTDNGATLDKGNGQNGIFINNGDGSQVLDNIISGNDNSGIYIGYSGINSTTGVTIQRNKIGINTINAALGNTGYGIYMTKATNIIMGGSVANDNVIANNSFDGIYVAPTSSGIDISANSIYTNGELGIDLDPDNVNPPNTAGPYAAAVNPPEIDSAKVNGTNLTIYGRISNLATTTYDVEFFRNPLSEGTDPSGYGEGHTYIGNTTVTTDGSGIVSFAVTISGGALYKDYISATSRMVSTSNTSEFALDKQVKSRIDTIAFGSGKYIRSYSIPPVPGATGYLWSVAPGASIILGQGTTSVTVDYAGTAVGNYEVCVVANNNCGPSDNSCFPVEMIELTLSGNVYDDANGMNGGNKVDGAGISTPGGTQLFVSIIFGGTVYETVPVNPGGSYTFIDLDNTLNYSVVLTTANTPAGNPAPAATLPGGWVNTGEINNDAGNTLTGNDGTINGIVPVGIVSSTETNVNFGIDQLPNSTDANTSYLNPGGTNKVTSPTLTGSDPEDGALGSGNTLVITTLAINGILYYDGIAVTLNQVITSYDPAKLEVDPIDGNVIVTFQYAFIDAAGFQDPTPATATLTFTDLTITGNVYDDNDGLTDNTVDGTGTNAGNTVYANLVSGANTVLASVAVTPGGTYSFGTADGIQINTSYNVILTNGSTTIGSTLTTATLPANWVSTGEFLGTGIGNDGSPNSVLAVSVVTTAVSNGNFGIDQLPNSNNANASYPNPGGTNTVTVPTLTGSDPEDGAMGSGNTLVITSLAANGILFYNGIAVTLNQVITSYDPSKLKVDPIDGDVVVTFQFAFVDAAGKQDPTPATATLIFFNLSISGTNVSCFGGSNGTATVTVLGGTTPYTYLWTDGQTTNPAGGLTAGAYTVTVTDFNGFSASASVTLTQPAALTVGLEVININCLTGANGAIITTVNGGIQTYLYLWSNGSTSANISDLTAGTYTVSVTDAHNCLTSGSGTITLPSGIPACINGPDNLCQGSTATYCLCPGTFQQGDTFLWTISGGTIINGCCGPCITVVWNHCNSGSVCVLIFKPNGCINSDCKNVILKPVPVPAITGPTIVNVGQMATYCTPAEPGDDYNWSVIGGSVNSGQGTNCLTVTWNTYCSSCQGMLIVNELRDGCCGIDTLYVTILPGTGNLTGYVIYKNLYNTGLNGVSLELRDTLATVLGTTITGPDPLTNDPGFYSFSNLGNGKYHIGGSFNGAWGGNNATDALIIELHTAHILTMAGLNLKVGDVNADLAVNSTDALWVKLRTIGMIGYYPAGDWKIEDSTFTLTGSASINLDALCEGDVNGSFIPSGFKDVPFISQVEDGLMTVPVGESFDYDIRSSRDAMLGAMTLFLDYDRKRFEVENVVTELDGMKYLVKDGKLSLAWSNTIPMVVNNGDPVITLRMKVKESLNSATQVFDIRGGSEFAGTRAERFDNFDLRMPGLKTYGMENKFSLGNYPNPFSNTTTIVYHIPEQAHVKLVLMNMFGEVLQTLVDADQAAGSYQVKVSPLDYNLNPGVYLYSIRVDGNTGTYHKVNKMVFTR